jgi:tetratricopeptide (TPR) repeat protein
MGIFAAVLVIRVTVLTRLTLSPFLLPSGGDMHFYDQWARRILEGHLTDHLAFYGLPGYAWLLAFIYKFSGYNPFTPALLQAVLDAGTATLIYKISRRVFDPVGDSLGTATGILASAGWAFFVPAQTYAVILMPTAWAVFVFWFVTWRTVNNDSAPPKTEALLLGLLIGLTATAVATSLFLVPLIAAAIQLKPIDRSGSGAPFRGTLIAVLALGVIAGTAPCWIYNCFAAHDRVFLSAHTGVNLWIGNNPRANGYPSFPPGLRTGQTAMLQDSIDIAEATAGHPLKRSEISGFWSAKARTFIHQHFVTWLRLIGLKAKNFWNAFQYDDLSVITTLREYGVTFPGIYFGLVGALALPGLLLAWKIAPCSRWLAFAIALHTAALLPVFITERYRLAAVPGLLMFAAFGLLYFASQIAAQQFRPALIYTCLLVMSAAFISWPQSNPALWALDAYNAGCHDLESGNLLQAEKKLQLAHAYVPENAETNFALGNLKVAQNDSIGARSFYYVTLQLDPQHAGALNNLGMLALQRNSIDEAKDFFLHAERLAPRAVKPHYFLALISVRIGDFAEARREVDRALALEPSRAEFLKLQKEIEQE